MAKRILVIPDVHGRLFWKEPVKQYMDIVDRVVFLGDSYGLNKVFQVFGHTKLNKDHDMIEFDDFAMIDSRQCFMIDESIEEKIISVKQSKTL